MEDLPPAPHGFLERIAGLGSVEEADAVAVDSAEHHDEAGQLEQRLALGLRTGAELQADAVLEQEEQGDLAFLDEFLAVGLAEAGGDGPVDVADVVAGGVFDNWVELHAAAAEGGAVFAAEHVLHGMAYAPLELLQQRELGGDQRGVLVDRRRRHGRGRRQTLAGTGVRISTWSRILSEVRPSASAS